MRIAIHQPNFIPWYPFFEKIQNVDRFIILTQCQFEKNNFQNRFSFNDKWHTMSVKKGLESIDKKLYINFEKDWNKIKTNLNKYDDILSKLDNCISENLAKTNICIIRKMCELLDIKTDIVTDYPTSLKSTDRLIDLCKYYGGTEYLSGSGAKTYLNTNKFKNIKVEFQNNLNKIHSLEVIKEKNEVS
tara:strand:- start:781 stop:1344 length:564 start_codon:yes stop_codon:yes gene_type:complete